MADIPVPIPQEPYEGTYKASYFDYNKYKIDQLSYPNNLQSEEFGGHKVMFYINIAEDSKFLGDKGDSFELDGTDIARYRGAGIAQDLSLVGAAASAMVPGILEAGIAGATLAKSTIWDGSVWNITKRVLLGAATGIGAGILAAGIGYEAVSDMAASATRKQKRLKSAIALHVPNSLQIRYSTNWESTDTATAFMAATGGEALMKFFDPKSQKLPTKEGNDGAYNSVVANIALTKGPNAGMMSSLTGLAANPRKEQVFKGVDFRTFTFDYQFFPKSSDEAKNVENIIKMFKFHMQPEMKGVDSFIYLYPSEFDIVYYKDEDENMHIHRHTSCVLVDMVINYTPNGNFNTFANGMPTQINISLTFKELMLMDKSLISNGL